MEKEQQQSEEDLRPRFAILVEGGVVQTVVSAEEHVLYRLIDLDGDHEERMIGDCLTDQEHVDIEVFTREALY